MTNELKVGDKFEVVIDGVEYELAQGEPHEYQGGLTYADANPFRIIAAKGWSK